MRFPAHVRRRLAIACLTLGVGACQKAPEPEHDTPTSPSAKTTVSAPLPVSTGAEHYFGDIPLVDQDGTKRRFYTDLMRGKTVVIDSFFASCSGACPKMAETLVKLQERLGDRLEKDVRFLSITVDVENDTPEALNKYAKRFGARRGWYFLTGEPRDVSDVLRKIGQLSKEPNDHSTMFIIGNEPTGLWKKALGLAKAEEVIQVAMSVVDDRGGDPSVRTPLGIQP